MPLYEYECEKCGRRFERIQKFSDPPADRCPHCGADSVRKLISSPAIQFKGSGWYITDYARKDAGSSDKPDQPKGSAEGADKATGASTGDTASKADAPSAKTEAKAESRSDSKEAKSSKSSHSDAPATSKS
jgi:putative FmdB family regulatory protein